MIAKVDPEAPDPFSRRRFIEEMSQKDRKPMKDDMIQRTKITDILTNEQIRAAQAKEDISRRQ